MKRRMVMVILRWICFATRRPALVCLSMLEHSVNWRQVTISQSFYLRNKTCLKGRIIHRAVFFCKEILSSGWPCSPRSFLSAHCRLPSSMLQVRPFTPLQDQILIQKIFRKGIGLFRHQRTGVPRQTQLRQDVDSLITKWEQMYLNPRVLYVLSRFDRIRMKKIGAEESPEDSDPLTRQTRGNSLWKSKGNFNKEMFDTLWKVTGGRFYKPDLKTREGICCQFHKETSRFETYNFIWDPPPRCMDKKVQWSSNQKRNWRNTRDVAITWKMNLSS